MRTLFLLSAAILLNACQSKFDSNQAKNLLTEVVPIKDQTPNDYYLAKIDLTTNHNYSVLEKEKLIERHFIDGNERYSLTMPCDEFVGFSADRDTAFVRSHIVSDYVIESMNFVSKEEADVKFHVEYLTTRFFILKKYASDILKGLPPSSIGIYHNKNLPNVSPQNSGLIVSKFKRHKTGWRLENPELIKQEILHPSISYLE